MVRQSARIVVAGAGIGGLTAATALNRQGFEVLVFERADETRGAAGSGLTIWTNALAALDTIGLADAVAGRGVELEQQLIYACDGTAINSTPVGRFGRSVGRPGVGIRRQVLLRTLFEGCAGIPLRYQQEVVGYRPSGDRLLVKLDSGAEIRAAALIGADGIRSRIRTAMFGDVRPEPEGHMIWRGISDSHEGFPRNAVFMVLGREGARAVSWPVDDNAVCWSISRNGPPGRGVDDPERTKDALLGMVARFPGPLVSILRNTPADRILRTDLFCWPKADNWVRGRVALLGDAAHATPTVYGQGACQAIEDAVVLAGALRDAGDVVQGLRDYERRRLPRVSWIRQRVFQLSRYQGWELPLVVAARNSMMTKLPRRQSEQTWRTLLTFDDTCHRS
jgi:FAD-dependent urate hydroxylase